MKLTILSFGLVLAMNSCQQNTVPETTTPSDQLPKSSEATEELSEAKNKIESSDPTEAIEASSSWVADYQDILTKYASPEGVNYKALKANDTAKLISLTNTIALTKATGSNEDKLAYYLNAYNIWMLKKAIDAYPVDSLLETDAQVYKRDDIKVGGKVMSLDFLENGIIRKDFADSRIHFALNCASGGCPALHTKVFKGESLNSDLDLLTGNFLKGPGIQSNGNDLGISKLFDWFKSDFTRDSPDGTVLGYIKKYNSAIQGAPNIQFLDYSWKLNEAQ